MKKSTKKPVIAKQPGHIVKGLFSQKGEVNVLVLAETKTSRLVKPTMRMLRNPIAIILFCLLPLVGINQLEPNNRVNGTALYGSGYDVTSPVNEREYSVYRIFLLAVSVAIMLGLLMQVLSAYYKRE